MLRHSDARARPAQSRKAEGPAARGAPGGLRVDRNEEERRRSNVLGGTREPDVGPSPYWMGETVPAMANGSAGAAAPAAPTSCQMPSSALVANARLPLVAGLIGTAVA